jgi:hypothetical protein
MEDRNKRFPIMECSRIKSIPWSVIAPHAQQALINHGQTLERLAERGGLNAKEAIAIIRDHPYKEMRDDDAAALIVVLSGELGY